MRKISKRYRGTQKQNRTMEIYALYFGRKIQHDKKSVLSESIYKFNLIDQSQRMVMTEAKVRKRFETVLKREEKRS